MSNPEQIPSSLSNLGEVLRAIERESGQPSQLVVKVGEDKYLVGDLRKRAGKYLLEMRDEYPNPFEIGKTVKNPHKKLARDYDSFDVLRKAVEKTQEQPGRVRGETEPAYLIGSPDHGYSVAVRGINYRSGGGQTYNSVGKIIFPLLQDGEKASVDKIRKIE